MIKRGKPAHQFTIHPFASCSRPNHTALCLAEIDALFEHSRLGRTAMNRRERITGMKEESAQFVEKGVKVYAKA
jgi:hypothetical protein